MPIKSACTLGRLLNGTYKSNSQPVLAITKNNWRAVQLSADDARALLKCPVSDAADPVAAAASTQVLQHRTHLLLVKLHLKLLQWA